MLRVVVVLFWQHDQLKSGLSWMQVHINHWLPTKGRVQNACVGRFDDQVMTWRSTWSIHGFLHGIIWIMFHGHLDYFLKPPLGGRPNTNPGDHGTSDDPKRWLILFYHVWGPAWIEIHWKSIWLRARSHINPHYTWGSVTRLHDFGGCVGLWTLFLLGSHNLMVTAFGSYVKWP